MQNTYGDDFAAIDLVADVWNAETLLNWETSYMSGAKLAARPAGIHCVFFLPESSSNGIPYYLVFNGTTMELTFSGNNNGSNVTAAIEALLN